MITSTYNILVLMETVIKLIKKPTTHHYNFYIIYIYLTYFQDDQKKGSCQNSHNVRMTSNWQESLFKKSSYILPSLSFNNGCKFYIKANKQMVCFSFECNFNCYFK